MCWKQGVAIAVLTWFMAAALPAHAADLRITIPRRGVLTPVQRLNQKGVKAIREHKYDKAKNLFYQAYLYDPDDPFTLNNLGYIAELEGQVERAARFYELAAQHAGDAVVSQATSASVEGKPLRAVVAGVGDVALQVNRENLEAMRLMFQGRVAEADQLLQKTLRLEPNNAFTLNNMGACREIQGELQDAVKYYNAAAKAGSVEAVMVTRNSTWRGKPISELASENAKRLTASMRGQRTPDVLAAEFNLRGVSAINRNQPQLARQDFQRAYQLDPDNAFSLNNLGYLAEMDGDWETAEGYYEKAQKANHANYPVGIATRVSAQGSRLDAVAQDNNEGATSKITAQRELRMRQQGPIELIRRGPAAQPAPAPASPTPPAQSSPEQSMPPLNPPQPR